LRKTKQKNRKRGKEEKRKGGKKRTKNKGQRKKLKKVWTYDLLIYNKIEIITTIKIYYY
jgi:hypothetical protein